MRILITGGAGYIGSHIVRQLGEAGHEIFIYDNLYSGHSWAILYGTFIQGDVGDYQKLNNLLTFQAFDVLIHFAAHIWANESIINPTKYYRNNTANAITLFELCAKHGLNKIIFSSSAAVYGQVTSNELIDENTLLSPINPYGASKMFTEQILKDITKAQGLSCVILRYFNVAGADLLARIGEATPNNNHLIKMACETVVGLRQEMQINGINYPTPDGTCIRDYIHVEDLATAHLAALDYLMNNGVSTTLNCGYGCGYSVYEILNIVIKIANVSFPIKVGARRPGDPSQLIAANAKIRNILNWTPRYNDVELIVHTALNWEHKLATMFTIH